MLLGYTPINDEVPWQAFGLKEWGFGKLDVVSDTQVDWSFIQSDINKVVDKMTLIKNH